jgi:hypothetical protein
VANPITVWPPSTRGWRTPFQLDESAYAPWTRMIVGFMVDLQAVV